MKKVSIAKSIKANLCLLALLAGTATGLSQIVIGPSGTVGPITFDARPAITDGWTTAPDDNGGGGDDTTAAGMDAGMQTNNVANIQTQVGSSTTVNPPSQNALARWNGANFYIQSRATSVRNTKLLATLQNNTGNTAISVGVEYDYGVEVRSGSTINEEIPGWRVYWSLTGQPDSWTVIPSLSSVATAGHLTATIPVGSWQPGAMLYILWLDDNGSDDDSAPTEEGVYTIDNVVFTSVSASGPLSIVNTNLPASIVTNEYATASFTLAVAGGAPIYQWYKGLTPISGATNATFTIASVKPSDAGDYRCVATNSESQVTSRTASLTVTPDVVPPAVISVQATATNLVTVTFSEALNAATATNLATYEMFTATGVSIPITAVALQGTNTVQLTLGTARTMNLQDWVLVRGGITDLAQTPNMMASTTVAVPAQETIGPVIMPMTNSWSYYTNAGVTPVDAAWNQVSYDASAWPSGPGVLGFETSAGTLTAFTNNGEAFMTPFGTGNAYTSNRTYYFRTTFDLTNFQAGYGLVAEGWIDDGAVFYLNGQRVGDIWPGSGGYPNLVAAPNPISYSDVTPDDIVNETAVKQVALNPTLLRAGVNTFAVEVHQNSDTSSDMVMGIRLRTVIPIPLTITAQPTNVVVAEGQPLSLTVSNTGTVAYYQWYRNNQPIANAINATYGATATTNLAGNYYVVISNAVSRLTSSVATVTVPRDIAKPYVTYAVMNTNAVHTTYGAVCVLTVQFSEPVLEADATNLNNYFVVRELDGNTNTPLAKIATAPATLANGTNLTVYLNPKNGANDYHTNDLWVANTPENYRLYIGNIHDLSPNANLMTTTNLLTYQRYTMMPANQNWTYNWTGTADPAWNTVAYGGAGFEGPAPAPFYNSGENQDGLGNVRAGWPSWWGDAWLNAPVSQTLTTYYYRTTFTLPTGPTGQIISPAGIQLAMQLMVDDGIVMWLNGQELRTTENDASDPNGRYYMTNGTEVVRATTLAQDHEGGTSPSTRTALFPYNLQQTNVLAVEVHQSAADLASAAPDHVFAMRLIATYPPLGQPVRPEFFLSPASVSTNVNASITLSAWADGSTPMTARWYKGTNATPVQTTTISTRTTNLINLALNNLQPASEGAYFLVVSNAAGVVTSAVANVVVQQPPTISAQPAGANVALRSDVTLSVTANGTVPLNYQWYFGNSLLFGQTNTSLTLRNVQSDNAGNYRVVVANVLGATTSSVAAVTITGGTANPPSLVAPNYVVGGGGGTFSLRVATEAGHTYTLQYNPAVENKTGWQPVPGASVAGDGTIKTLTDTTAPTSGKRFYRIAVN